MKKILVVSDSHGNTPKLREIVEREKPFDCIVHCGDGVNDLIHAALPPGAVTYAVMGNIDLGRGVHGERRIVTTIAGRTILITHGDLYGAHNGLRLLEEEGRKLGADIVLFGHTHVKYLREDKPALFNPGPANNGCYGVVSIGEAVDFRHGLVE